jgi:transcriptional regulator with XRE-family HTH domain
MTPKELLEHRKDLDWSQQQTADRLGVTLRTYEYYEKGITSSGTELKQVPKSVAAAMLAYIFARRLEELHVPPKAEPKPARARTRRPYGGLNSTDVIRVIQEPRFNKSGIQNVARWQAAGPKDGRTVAEVVRLGLTVGDIKWQIAHGNLKLERFAG